MYVETCTRIIRHLFYRAKLVSVTQFSPRLMDFCSSPWSIANLPRGNEGDRGRAHREMNRKELWRANEEYDWRERKRDKKKRRDRVRRSNESERAAERKRERTRRARVSRSGKFISTITGARRMAYTRFGNEGLALVRNSRVARVRVFRKKP